MKVIKINLLFAGHDFKFIDKIIAFFKNSREYNIKVDKWYGHNSHDLNKSRYYLEWADIIFCEWGLGNTCWYSQNKKKNQKLIVRMHSQELRTKYSESFNMDNIDKIIAVSPYIYGEFFLKLNIPKSKMIMIYNYVDCSALDNPKIKSSNYALGIMGICPKIKRLDKAIDIFEGLIRYDKRYKLYIKGKHPNEYKWLWRDSKERLYYETLFDRIDKSKYKNNIIFDEYGKDIEVWLKKIGYILSTSDFESFHLSVAEGMASGSIPIILNREGAETIYPSQYISNSIEDAIERIYKYKSLIEDKSIKDYAKSNFDIYKIIKEIEELF